MIIKKEHGSLSLELAIILPILIILLVGSIFLGISYINKSAILDASFVGSKSAAYYGGDTPEVREDIYRSLEGRFVGDPNNIVISITFEDSTNMVYGTSNDTLLANDFASATPEFADSGDRIVVDVTYNNYVLDMPLVDTKILDLKATSISRNANP